MSSQSFVVFITQLLEIFEIQFSVGGIGDKAFAEDENSYVFRDIFRSSFRALGLFGIGARKRQRRSGEARVADGHNSRQRVGEAATTYQCCGARQH